MKKSSWVKFLGILLLIALFPAYFFLYLVPGIENINQQKRLIKDLNAGIQELKNSKTEFLFPDQQEEALFNQAQQEFNRRLPGIATAPQLNALQNQVSAYLETRAAEDGILNLQTAAAQAGQPGCIAFELTFSGALPNALDFINHIPWSDTYHITPTHIEMAADSVSHSIQFRVVLHIYFQDQRPGREETPQPGIPGDGIIVDFDSPLLTERVYRSSIPSFTRRQLPRRFE